ncbi:2'-5' RNA ligase family protein [Psychrobium sp. MM17-31]|uniref:2'-5' RNA ligase family protein n=1 Tax=Psychrobium sp. MM17-31 TaxID=2917758 RepID=UPI001EF55A36|nr:2'-5' RNA ligase family protein [Psychrobium sp. MM17-31]MCG7532576.1 2'-5' RNA ligase family protein [Psychrobium sp. MM17-31]
MLQSVIKKAVLIAALIAPMSTMAGEVMHTLKASLLKDRTGLVYIGYDVDKKLLKPYLSQLQAHLGEDKFKVFRAGQAKRDHNHFHITLINPFEHPDVKSIDVATLPEISFTFEGLGTAANDKDRTFFVVVSSDKAQQVRKAHGLKTKDFHVTLGFDSRDVFGVSKGMDSLLDTKK